MKTNAQQILTGHRTMNFSQLLKTILFSETTISQARQAFICLDSATLIVE